jgi:D-lactate dehydrogenase
VLDEYPRCRHHTQKIAAELAEKPFYPLTSTCWAFAGDRGLQHEELTCSAPERKPEKCANRTCEVGMERATHAPYESFLYALEELTRAQPAPHAQ